MWFSRNTQTKSVEQAEVLFLPPPNFSGLLSPRELVSYILYSHIIYENMYTHIIVYIILCSTPCQQDMIELATEAFDFDVQRVLEECGPEDNAERTDRSQMLLASCQGLC